MSTADHATCREQRCAHVLEQRADGYVAHRCAMGLAPVKSCAWRETPEQMRIRARTADYVQFMGSHQ